MMTAGPMSRGHDAAPLTRVTPEEVAIDRRYAFEDLRIVPNSFDRDLMVLTIGSHDPNAQRFANTLLPVKVFNLSITAPEVIEATHERMREAYHPEGGAWHREDMPRTVFVFLNEEEGLTPEERCAAARLEAEAALAAYWRALDGTWTSKVGETRTMR